MGFNIRITEGLSIIMKVNIKSYMMDIAVAHYYLGLGGAYCYLCDFTKKTMFRSLSDRNRIWNCKKNIDNLDNIYNELVKEDGTILKKRNYYNVRGWLTTKPIPTNNVLSVQVHYALRIFDVFMKIIVHLRAGVLEWSESPKSENKPILIKAKSDI